ncbi:Glycosyltransferase involved in cell wall bisynthesis [Jatrophihabitans endophyticus]|uniref:Glycosyltransferase involved in cell wall bisynthesis n=1 Tax=Jatrophihabitans endophyticus TaxID=1206085 RepID=A0A1M5LCB7_9ACTN|nr:glycosyltransferase family 2 protein [Jatrophihabitans endophyticus]SHG62691.1 Glycosyltransferase involved in cell wall bisynthesis [Jatrophihabitans endophyticus]
MPTDPTLTVVLPVRNVAAYLPDMLTSLGLNTDVDLQLVVVDDGSDDGTAQVIEEFADRLPQLQAIRHDTAVGLADARNAGLDRAVGRHVCFLDGDDWLAPGYLGRLVHAIDGLGCDFVRVDHVQVRDRDRVVHLAPEARRDVVLDPRSGILPASRRTMIDYPYAWAGIFRRELGELLRFPAGLHTAEDRPWIWRLHREARSYAVTSLAGVFYRRDVANSLTQIGDHRQLQFVDAYAMVLAQVSGDAALLGKAMRQFLGIVAHQVEQGEERFTAPLRRQLAERVTELLAGVDPDVVGRALPGDDRIQVLAPLLPAAVLGRRWAS